MAVDLVKLDAAITSALTARANYKRAGSEHWCACPNAAHEETKPGSNFSYTSTKAAAKCFGCGAKWNAKELAAALGIDPDSEAFKNGTSKPPAGTVVARYDYIDADGVLRYYVERIEFPGGKRFAQYRPDGASGVKGVQRLLYRLPAVLEAGNKWVFLVEGEKCVHALEGLGFVATCNSGGAEAWKPELAAFLTGAKVCLLPDNDKAGRKWTDEVLASLIPVASVVKVGLLPAIDLKGDVVDWIAAGGTAETLKDIVRGTPPTTAIAALELAPLPEPEHFTDLGNARRYIRHNGNDLRYVSHFGKGGRWLVWDGVRWAQDFDGEAERRAKATVMSMHVEAVADEMGEYPSLKKAAAKWAYSSESRGRIESMLKLSQTEAGITIQPAALDADPWLVACTNGTLDLRTGSLSEANREHLITKRVFAEHDPNATCPRWERFVLEVMGGSEDMAAFLKRAAGYSLTGETSEQCVFILFGGGANGKSTFIDTLHKAMGEYAETANIDSFLLKQTGAATNDLAALAGARFVSAGENDSGRRLSEALVKQLTSGESMKARFLYAEDFAFEPQMKVWLSTNHKPTIRGADHGIWRRIHLVPFEQQFELNKTLKTELLTELPGIFRWVVEGCAEWRAQGLAVPGKVSAATAAYKDEMDILSDWLFECAIQERGVVTGISILYESYKEFSDKSGEKMVFSQKKFALLLDERGFENVRTMTARGRKNIRLRDNLLDSLENEETSQVQSMTGMTDRPLFPTSSREVISEEYIYSENVEKVGKGPQPVIPVIDEKNAISDDFGPGQKPAGGGSEDDW